MPVPARTYCTGSKKIVKIKIIKMKYNTQSHPFHLVEPSPWPLTTSIGLGIMAMGGVIFFSGLGSLVLIIGFVITIMTSSLWWRDCIREGILHVALFLNLIICRETSQDVNHFQNRQSAGNIARRLWENLRDYRLNIASSVGVEEPSIDKPTDIVALQPTWNPDESMPAYLGGPEEWIKTNCLVIFK